MKEGMTVEGRNDKCRNDKKEGCYKKTEKEGLKIVTVLLTYRLTSLSPAIKINK